MSHLQIKVILTVVALVFGSITALTLEPPASRVATRRQALGWFGGAAAAAAAALAADPAVAAAEQPEVVNVDDYLRTGLVSQPMGVSGQAGKSRPETRIVFREGTDVARDARTGDVSAEILLASPTFKNDMVPVFASYSSPWPLATGAIFDIECRDLNTGEAAFLAVSPPLQGKTLDAMKDSFFVKELTKPTGRFSLYGQPTDIKVKNSIMARNNNQYRQFDLSFSTLSQSTQAEIPRRARVIVTIPEGTDQAVMLVASASANRWKNGAEKTAAAVVDSFQAIPAPTTSLKIRAKARPNA